MYDTDIRLGLKETGVGAFLTLSEQNMSKEFCMKGEYKASKECQITSDIPDCKTARDCTLFVHELRRFKLWHQ